MSSLKKKNIIAAVLNYHTYYKRINKMFLLITFNFITLASFSQLDSKHYLPPLKQTSGNNNGATHQSVAAIKEQAIYLSTPETTPFTVNVYKGTDPTPWRVITNLSNGAPHIINASGGTPNTTGGLTNSNNNITLVTNENTGKILSTSGLCFEAPGGEKFYVNYRGRSSSQAGSLTCKGTKALGTDFRWGGIPNRADNKNLSTSLGILATEANTNITISGYNTDCVFRDGIDPDGITADVINITLQKGETYVLEALKNETTANIDGWLGATIQSNKPIAIANGGLNFGVIEGKASRDVGIDQPVATNILGREYAFVRGNGISTGGNANKTEFPVIIATQNGTQVFANGNLVGTINDGEYLEVPSSYYSSNTVGANMHVTTSQDVYAYQCLSGQEGIQTLGMNFIAPLNCLLPDNLNEVPQIDKIAGVDSNISAITIIASNTIPDSDVKIYQDGVQITTPASIAAGTSAWKTFYVSGLTGEISIETGGNPGEVSGPIAVGTFMAFGKNAGLAGYFSGFDTVPAVSVSITGGGCYPGTGLEETTGTFGGYQWYKDGTIIPGATSSTFDPVTTGIGSYYVEVDDAGCKYTSPVVNIYSCDPDLYITKVDDADPINAGDNVIFTVTAKNLWEDPLTNVVLTDVLPSEFSFVSATPTKGTIAIPNWNIGTMNPGEELSVEIVVTAKDDASGLVTNQVTYNFDQIASEVNNLADDLEEEVTINPCNFANPASSLPEVCINTVLPNVIHTTTIATGISNDGITGTNGLPPGVSATWNNNTITISGTPTASGIYNYEIPLTGGCNTVSATGAITVFELPVAQPISGANTVCIGSTTTLTQGTSGTINWNSSNTSVATIDINGLVTTLATGTTDITYTVTDVNGCTSNSSAIHTITVNPLPEFNTITTNSDVCEGEDAIFTITGSSNAILTYNLDGNPNQTTTLNALGEATITNTSVSTNTTINLISLEFNDTSCLLNLSNSETITVNANPTLTDFSDLIECAEIPTQTLDANNAITFGPNISVQWYDAAVGGNIVATPTLNTIGSISYFAEVTNTSTSCVNPNRVEVELSLVTPPFPNFSETVCSNEALNINVGLFSSTYTVVSSDPTNVPAAANRTVATSANITDTYINKTNAPVTITYTITVDTPLPCQGEVFDVIVTVNPEPFNISAPADTVCSNVPLNHDLNTDVALIDTTFNWQATDNPNVIGETITPTNLSSITDTLINTTSSIQTVTYTITPTSVNGCQGDTFVYTVSVHPEIIFTTQTINNQSLCVGATSNNLQVVVSGAVSGISYQWESSATSGSGFMPISGAINTSYTPPTNTSGITYYRVVVSDDSSICNTIISNEAEITINIDPVITVQPPSLQEVCINAIPTDISVVANGGANGLTYQWESSPTSGSGFIPISGAINTSYTPITNIVGTTYYRVVIDDTGGGCDTVISNESTLVVNSQPTITRQPVDSQTLCKDAIPYDLEVIPSGGANGLTYQWEESATKGTGFTAIVGATNASYTPQTATRGTTYYRVVISDAGNGCNSITSEEAEVTINRDPRIQTQPLTSQSICLNSTPSNLTVIANGGVIGLMYQWEESSTSGTGFTAIVGATSSSYTPPTNNEGTMYYRVVISDVGDGCDTKISDESEVIVNSDPTAEAGVAPGVLDCDTLTLTLDGTGSTTTDVNYLWTGGTIDSGATTLSPVISAPGTYTLTVTNTITGCISSDTVVITQDLSTPTAEAGVAPGVLDCDTLTLTLDGTGSTTTDVNYLWTGGTID
ncbi:PKD-like domain-containing protein, partial [Tenacibaculum sp. 190524A02b]|uniref:PKD-like domain-containing protein n=1 Tax=Tenacibaculum vairaonense TaxID=3137860 RepID=UPI0032B1A0DD